MPIPLLDLKRQYATLKDEILRVTEEVYDSQAFILGKRVEDFEKEFAAYCHNQYAVGLSSGTDALLIALMVYGVKPGDEVIVPAYSFFATAGVVTRLGAVPVFVDVEPAGLNLDPALIEPAITPRTVAIMPVHLYGQCAEMDAISAFAARHGLKVIEDAAQAVGAELDGRRAGTLGDLACFSFFPSKNLGAFGDAGAVTTNDRDLYERLVDFRVHGMRPKYFHKYVGGNFRIDALQAAILQVKLKYLEGWTEARQRNAETYRVVFGRDDERILLPETLPRRRHVYNQYVIRFAEGRAVRDRVMQKLKDAGIGCEIYYPLTLPAQQCFRGVPSARGSFPVSDAAAETSLAIPIFPELTRAEIEQVVSTILKAL
jgi:dTDP-4-amino-4,6-dideoxygalactose transaminase